ncbi:MAG: hypothetical protein IIC60_07640 [Proteobacteria bacterium]|nr:hypothetical protein [Pseudomonadota bacterium]
MRALAAIAAAVLIAGSLAAQEPATGSGEPEAAPAGAEGTTSGARQIIEVRLPPRDVLRDTLLVVLGGVITGAVGLLAGSLLFRRERKEKRRTIAAVLAAELNHILSAVEASIEEESRITAAVIEQSVKRWISTWENRTLELYFASYHPDFVSRYHDTQAAWRRNRQRVIGNAQWISLEMTEFQIVSQNSDNIEVQFWLSYASPTYRDDTLKKLLLRKEAGAWLIVEEINLVVRS